MKRHWLDQPAREVPVVREVDLAVCGGGPAGIAAALAAAEAGVRVLLVERYGFPGGMATAGLVNPIYGFGYFSETRQIVQGIPERFVRELSRVPNGTLGHRRRSECSCCPGGLAVCPTRGISSLLSFDPEAFKYIALKMMDEAGVELLLHSLVVQTLVEERSISGIVVANKAGMQAVKARVVVDCTGDGDVAALAGNPYEFGRRRDGAVQPSSLILRIANVDRREDRIPPDQVYLPSADRARLPSVFLFRLPREGEYIVNYDCGIYDANPLLAEDLTRVQSKALNDAEATVRALREFGRGCERVVLICTAAQMGIRESRRIIGDYILKAEDVVSGRKFEDGVARVAFPIDIHSPTGRLNEENPLVGPKCGDYYEIPYRSLLARETDNLLMAGRCISGSHEAHGSYRVMAPCMATGQAAGTAAALSVKHNVIPRAVGAALLRDTLRKQGVWI